MLWNEHRIIMIYRLIVRHMCTLVEQELLTIPEHRIIMIYRLIFRHMCTLVEQELDYKPIDHYYSVLWNSK
jgi:hypothetical protein